MQLTKYQHSFIAQDRNGNEYEVLVFALKHQNNTSSRFHCTAGTRMLRLADGRPVVERDGKYWVVDPFDGDVELEPIVH